MVEDNISYFNDFKSLEGKLLAASPHLEDPYFERTLIYMCAHDVTGAIGVMINQQIGTISLKDFLKNHNNNSLDLLNLDKKFPILFGGPINTERTIAISINKQQEKAFSNTNNKVTLHTDINKFSKDIASKKLKPSKLLLIKGISAWESKQLEEEISENQWFIADPSLELLFSQRIRHKWDMVIKDLGVSNFSNLVQYSGNA